MMNITEDYVSFETAKILKEKGFDEPTTKSYYTEGFENPMIFSHDLLPCIRPDEFLCPTLQMAMKWLRKRHNIHIAIMICSTENPEKFKPEYYAYVLDTNTGESLIKEKCPLVIDDTLTPKGFESPELVAEAAIKYCLEKLI